MTKHSLYTSEVFIYQMNALYRADIVETLLWTTIEPLANELVQLTIKDKLLTENNSEPLDHEDESHKKAHAFITHSTII